MNHRSSATVVSVLCQRLVESDEIQEHHPEVRGHGIITGAVLKHRPPGDAAPFFTKVSAAIEVAGIGFGTRMLEAP